MKTWKTTAMGGNIEYENKLPLPYVHYPGYCGTFIGFSEECDSKVFFCECSKTSIFRYFHMAESLRFFASARGRSILSTKDFPLFDIDEHLASREAKDEKLFSSLQFMGSLCHRCNDAVPELEYCSAMYVGLFMQFYGWYVNQNFFLHGIHPDGFNFCPAFFPMKIATEFESASPSYFVEYPGMKFNEPFGIHCSSLEHQEIMKSISSIIENDTRREFGFKVKGKENLSETILYKIVRDLFPEMEVKRHTRPRFLKGLELDIYLPEIHLGVEYQGVQHFRSVDHWGGQDGLESRKKRDVKKRRLCQSEGIFLLKFKYDNPLSRRNLIAKLGKAGFDVGPYTELLKRGQSGPA